MAQTIKAIWLGVIADTHGLFDPAVRRHFRGVDHILHAGDIGDRFVIEQLERIAPVTAVSGNVDENAQSGFPSEAIIKLAGRRIVIRHILYILQSRFCGTETVHTASRAWHPHD